MNKLENKNVKRYSGKDSSRITDECLEEALLELMKTKNIEHITVTELTKLAGVSRSSFYRRYDEPADILRSIADRYINQLAEGIHKREYRETPREWFYDVFKLAYDNADILKRTANSGVRDGDILGGYSFTDGIFTYDTIEDHYRNVAFETAIKGIITDWLFSGMKESLDEITDIAYSIFKDNFIEILDKVSD